MTQSALSGLPRPYPGIKESGRFRGVRFEGVRVGLGKLLACLNLPYRLLRFINFA